jgi:hypothetical protein
MSRASEDALGNLHSSVARVLDSVVTKQEEVVEYDEEGNATPTGEMEYTCTPAMMAAAIKFLKDNSITCDIEQSENMGNLREALGKKQKRSRMSDPKVAARTIGAAEG